MLQDLPYQEKYYTSQDGLTLYYRDYNASHSTLPPLLCLHGLTRNSKDFHKFASLLSQERRVISLDIRGRGQSDYDPHMVNYQIPTYAQDVLTFLDHEKLEGVIAVGTSMGGLISMTVGAIRPTAFKGIILNDIGPEIDPEGIQRISGFVGTAVVLKNWKQALQGIKVINGNFFPDYTKEDWQTFARNTFRERDDGSIIADYDQNIGTALREQSENVVPVDLWPLFCALKEIPLLTLRGENSDILSADTLKKMADEHPNFTAVTVPNRAHTPDLTEETSLREIRKFLHKL